MHGLKALAPNGILRAAINTGNRALVQQDGANLAGVSPALARRLAAALGARLQPVIYPGAGAVFEDALQDTWDVAFLAVDTTRAEKVSFTRPYVTIEATFAVRANASIHSVSEIDLPGHRLLTSEGSAYDLHLTKTLRHAHLDRLGTPPESFAAFATGTWDAVAGVRASLQAAFGEDPDIRILQGSITEVQQAMVLPGAQNPLTDTLDDFVAHAIAEGFVAAHLNA